MVSLLSLVWRLADGHVPTLLLVLYLGGCQGAPKPGKDWVAVQELNLSYHNQETLLFTIYKYYGN